MSHCRTDKNTQMHRSKLFTTEIYNTSTGQDARKENNTPQAFLPSINFQ